MRYLQLARVALLLGAVATAVPVQANMKHRFVVIDTKLTAEQYKQELAKAIRESVRANPEGHAVISSVSCSRDNACATPAKYLQMYLEKKDKAILPSGVPLTRVDQLADFIDGLVVKEAPVGKAYWMACLYGPNAKTAIAKLECLSDTFLPGEMVLVDPRTGQIFMRVKCSNPVDKPDTSSHCVYQHVYLKKGDTLHKFWMGPSAYPAGPCIPAVQKAGETEWSIALLDACPEQCNGVAPFNELKKLRKWGPTARVWKDRTVSFVADREGWYIFRNRAEVIGSESEDALCKTNAAGIPSMTTYMPGVSYNQNHSYATYGDAQPKDWKGVVFPWHVNETGKMEQP